MERIITKLTSKGQTTIPKQVRESLGLSTGDALTFEIREGEVIVRKLPSVDLAWDRAVGTTLSEWHDSLDDEL